MQAMEQTSGPYEFFTLIAVTYRALIDELHRELARRGYDDLRPVHGFAFQRMTPEGATGNDLANFLDITKQAASQMIDYLEKRGYVTRRPHPRDKREKLVILTEKGWACAHAAEETLARLELRSAGLLGFERMQAFRVDLYRLALLTNNGIMPARLRPIW